jgi:methylated-DNA-[protein]-cysteine S-methyltransferase
MTAMLRIFLDYAETPLGRFAIAADEEGRLRASGFADQHARMERQLQIYASSPKFSVRRESNPGGLTAAVERYFAGDLAAIGGLPIFIDGTPFQCAVWQALREIPFGETRSYAAVARQVGNPAAVRAVGLANGSNPIGLILPCHRVIGSDGSLTGYGGGVERKRWLLAHENPVNNGNSQLSRRCGRELSAGGDADTA